MHTCGELILEWLNVVEVVVGSEDHLVKFSRETLHQH